MRLIMQENKASIPNKRVLRGVVVRDKMLNTVTVKVTRTVRHDKYNKFIRRESSYHVHDPKQAAAVGDSVLIVETRPVSKTKRWKLKEVVAKAL
jgi:small subunit ribosomal protein S17